MQIQSQFNKSLTIIWIGFITGLLLLIVVAYFVIIPQASSTPVEATAFYFIAVLLAAGGMIGSNFMYQVQVRSAAQLVSPAPERLQSQYITAIFIKLSLLEGPGIFSVAAAILTQQTIFVALSVGILILMGISKPSEQQFRNDFLKS